MCHAAMKGHKVLTCPCRNALVVSRRLQYIFVNTFGVHGVAGAYRRPTTWDVSTLK